MKYMGSKKRIAKYILPIILKDRKEGQWYVETMIGGLNSISEVEGNRIGSDNNHYLIGLYKSLQLGWMLPVGIDLDFYEKVKNNKDKYPIEVVALVGFCFTYSAKWFGGFIGNTKDKVCIGRDRIGESYRAAEKARVEAQGIELFNCSYDELEIPPQSIIYCDPPYAGTTKYKDDFDHNKFFDWCREKCKEGHKVFISEYNAPDDFICVWQREIQSGLNTNTTKKGIEKLFVHESQV